MNKTIDFKPVFHAIVLLAGILIIGIAGFSVIEHYNMLDALFMTIITVTTVGFEEVHPLSAEGKIFTSLLIIVSFGIFAFAASTIARYVVSGVFLDYFKYTKVKKEIDKLENHVIVVGYGRNGSQAVDELIQKKIQVVIIDNRDSKIAEVVSRNNLLYLHDDPSSDEVLVAAGVMRAKALISVLPTDEENLFVVLTTRELNKNITIISRAINTTTIKKLKTAGASHVLMPDKISGQQMAKMIAQPEIVEFLDFLLLEHSNDTQLSEICLHKLPDVMKIGDLRKDILTSLNIVGMKKAGGNYIVNPGLTAELAENDRLFILGNPGDIQMFKQMIETGSL